MSGDTFRLKPSLLDRLLDPASGRQGLRLRELHIAVRRDLEALLNARRPWASLPASRISLRGTMLGFGLPDYAAGTFNAMAEREALCKEVAATIARFEPRLTQIRVTPRDRADTMEPVLRIRIEARLLAEDADEPVSFDALLDATTADMVVGPAANV